MPELLPDVPEPDSRDQLRKVIVAALGPIPGASLVVDLILASPFQDRLIDWLRDLAEKFERLCERVEEIDPNALVKEEEFKTTFVNAMRLVTYTNRKEKHEMLRNAVLNSALPDAPEDDERTVFLNLVESFSVAHIQCIRAFNLFPREEFNLALSLDAPHWRADMAVNQLYDFIQNVNSPTDLDFDLFLLILTDLHSRGLLSSIRPESDKLDDVGEQPRLTTLGRKFLQFIESPLDDKAS
ncbi:MAG: hypothetical protein OXF63_11495 [Anaerolineaceae bacterium]|nr:hypothetical protein [Anaerolineaceae bacterium]